MADNQKPFDPVEGLTTLRDNFIKAVDAGVRSVTNSHFPPLDVYRDGNTIVVQTIPLDGLDASTIEVAMEGEILTISGVTRPTLDIDPTAYIRRERSYGKFERSIVIPVAVEATAAKAKVRDGILTVTFPTTAPDEDDVIDVQVTE